MTETFRIAGYTRISVDDEIDRDNVSIENQKAIIEDFVKTQFPGSSLTFFEDRDRSGYTFEQREGYQEMRRACLRRCAGRTIRREGKAAWALVTGHGARYRQPHHRAVSGNQSIEQKKGETMRFPTLNFEAFSISAILRILKLINASKTHFSINNSKSYYKMRKTLFFWFVQFHTVLEVYEPQTLV